jgi:phospholipid/cholesterol/gamma-HCH transport system substrate-binding protein
MKFRIRHADRIVGAFVVFALLALAGGIFLLGANQRWFAKDYKFVSRFPSAAGASAGTAIYLKGFQVGKVQRVKLNEQNEVDVDVVIYDTYYPKARDYSLLELSVSPIGLGTQILFHPGNGAALLEPGTFIPLADSERGRDWIEQGLVEIPVKDDTIARLLEGVSPLIDNISKTVVTVNRTLTEVNRAIAGQSSGPLGRIVATAANATDRAEGFIGQLEKLLADVRKQTNEIVDQVQADAGSIAGKADSLVATLASVADNVQATTAVLRDPTGLVPKLLDPKGSVKSIMDDGNALYEKVFSSINETEKTLKNVQEITAALSDQMPSVGVAIEEGRGAIKKAQDVLEGLKNNPLLKGGIPERKEQQSLYQSMRDGKF